MNNFGAAEKSSAAYGGGPVQRAPQIFGGTTNVYYGGLPGYSYYFERSNDGQSWALLDTIVMPTNGLFYYLETNPPPGSLLYRMRPVRVTPWEFNTQRYFEYMSIAKNVLGSGRFVAPRPCVFSEFKEAHIRLPNTEKLPIFLINDTMQDFYGTPNGLMTDPPGISVHSQ